MELKPRTMSGEYVNKNGERIRWSITEKPPHMFTMKVTGPTGHLATIELKPSDFDSPELAAELEGGPRDEG